MTISLVYFSPTNTTKQVVEKIAEGFDSGQKNEEIDLTKSYVRDKTHSINTDLCIIGAPCYEARIPPLVRKTLRTLDGNKVPTVAVILYGNRTIGISLKQLVGILDEQNFSVIATGTFIGEHSYASERLPMALGRPNQADLSIAAEFGHKLATKGLELPRLSRDDIPGKIKTLFKLLPEGFLGSFGKPSAVNREKCNECGTCVKLCPTDAINEESLEVDMNKCIRCMACVKFCLQGARTVEFRLKGLVDKFMGPAVRSKREPKYYFADEIVAKRKK